MARVLILSNPRSGSTFLKNLLNCHPEVNVADELLNDEVSIVGDPLDYLADELSRLPETVVGFKAFPEQILSRGQALGHLLRRLGTTHVVVLWRESLLESFVSHKIAVCTGVWYVTAVSAVTPAVAADSHRIEIDPSELEQYADRILREWSLVAEQWPAAGVRPIFLRYEDLLRNPVLEVTRILTQLSCASAGVVFETLCQRQNPREVADKVSNWDDLSQKLRDLSLNVPHILEAKIAQAAASVAPPFAPDAEPRPPAAGWTYRVAEPFLPAAARQNVFDAVEAGSVSSAGHWPRQLATKLRRLFQAPVAQPCSNGFSALMLAMQAVEIKEGDEVIMPAMTMVAVPNAVHFLRGTPVFVDCAAGDYNPSWTQILAAASDRTRAVVVTHTYGVPTPSMECIAAECKARGWWLIEDISECVGVRVGDDRRLLGTYGDLACASLYANKIIHGGDGGFIVAKDPRLAARLSSLVNHGFTPSYHFVHLEPAINGKIHGLAAALACGCLEQLDLIMDHRAGLAKAYREGLRDHLPPGTKLMPQCGPLDTPWVFGMTCLSKGQRTDLRAFLAMRGIETRDFFFPLHLQPAYSHLRGPQSLSHAEELGSTGFYLPTHTNLQLRDIEYICSSVRAFFGEGVPPTAMRSLQLETKAGLQIQAGGYRVQLRSFNEGGALRNICHRGHPSLEVVKLGLCAEDILIHERWDERELFLESVKKLVKEAKDMEGLDTAGMEAFFAPYVAYFQSQRAFEQQAVAARPWLQVDLTTKAFERSATIPTTTDPETLQLLAWLVQETKPEVVWEIGCWMGRATALMAEAAAVIGHQIAVYACDAFRWQAWMESYLEGGCGGFEGTSFLDAFLKNTAGFGGTIQHVDWPYSISDLPEALASGPAPDLVFLDITQEEEDLDAIWRMIRPRLVSGRTTIVFNGLAFTSIPFFTRWSGELVAIAKPHTIAKAFQFMSSPAAVVYYEADLSKEKDQKQRHLVNVQTDPTWTHHHQNLFCSVIQQLREVIHDDAAAVAFFPAVEERLCDEPDLFLAGPWVGIVHSVADYPELFYTPDLRRLCSSPKFAAAMRNCKGLFTLTKVQAEFLVENLQHCRFPVQPLVYPIVMHPGSQSQVPDALGVAAKGGNAVDLVLAGSFARDFDLFFCAEVPAGVRKVLLISDDTVRHAARRAPKDVLLLERLDGDQYETLLERSIMFLSLKYDGAANTLVLECIARNVPIVAPSTRSCKEYLGEEYPLLYSQEDTDLRGLITAENVRRAIHHLATMDKSRFTQQSFVKSVRDGAVMRALSAAASEQFTTFDVTVCICSFKRTHHLGGILRSLWSKQDFGGSIQIIVWNNNVSREAVVKSICDEYVQRSDGRRSLEMVSSTANYYCSVRFAMPQLMRSDALLICDDDVVPGPRFVSFFASAHARHPSDVLCLRGHVFLPHALDAADPTRAWKQYDGLRFRDDSAPEQLIHFIHADACLIPRRALLEVASTEMPDRTFALVDDYWLSFVLSHTFGRKLRKLSLAGTTNDVLERTEDSEEVGLAMHTRPEVEEARLRLYLYHMLRKWPSWEEAVPKTVDVKALCREKRRFWDGHEVGFNVSSKLDLAGIKSLVRAGVMAVRVGAVGIREASNYDLSGFLVDPEAQLRLLAEFVRTLGDHGVSVVITLDRRLALADTWNLIATEFSTSANVVGYDLVNEPYTEKEVGMHWTDVAESNDVEGVDAVVRRYEELILAVRKVDAATPIVVESSFWAQIVALPKLPLERLLELDANLVVSFHFYEPMLLTFRTRNGSRFGFPGAVPVYDVPGVEAGDEGDAFWDTAAILARLRVAKSWAEDRGVKIFAGEFGICRDVAGAADYLSSVLSALRELGLAGFLFSFRDPDWEAMDYELGTDEANLKLDRDNWETGDLMRVILKGVEAAKE